MTVCFVMYTSSSLHPQDFEIQVYGYKSVGDPQCLWTFHMRDSVLALDTEVEGGRVSQHLSIVLFIFSQSCDGGGGGYSC